jgi:hypothetical protein
MRPLLAEAAFAEYRRFRSSHKEVQYTEPFVPCVDDAAFGQGLPRFVYCGAAVAERELVEYGGSDHGAWKASQSDTAEILRARAGEEIRLTPFWRLWDSASRVLFGSGTERSTRMLATVWTNLSKLGVVDSPAPLDDADLSGLDAAQFTRELDELKPDILLCVSGEMLIKTGNALFEDLPRLGVAAATRGTLFKRLPAGGVLVWTNHPAHLRGKQNEAAWYKSVLGDLETAVKVSGVLTDRSLID